MTLAKSSETESKQNTPRVKSKSTDKLKKTDRTYENNKEDEQFNAEIIDRIAEIDIKTNRY
jgi:hypothetical protein